MVSFKYSYLKKHRTFNNCRQFIKQISLLFAVMTQFYCCTTPAKNNEEKAYKIKLQWSGIGPDFGTGSISTDGEYLTDINWNTGNLKIINLETNITREIEGSGYEEGGYAWMSSFSNKGDQIAYEWYNYESGTHELRLYSMESAENKILMQSSDSIYYWEPLDWTQHDDQILVAKQLVESNGNLDSYLPLTENTEQLHNSIGMLQVVSIRFLIQMQPFLLTTNILGLITDWNHQFRVIYISCRSIRAQ